LELTGGKSGATLSVMGSANDSTTSSEPLDRLELERDIPTTDEDVRALRRHRAAKLGGAAKRSQGAPLSSSETGISVAANEPELRWKVLTCGGEFSVAAENFELRRRISTCGVEFPLAVEIFQLRCRVLSCGEKFQLAAEDFNLRQRISTCGGKFSLAA
jgi:hypothetical protein